MSYTGVAWGAPFTFTVALQTTEPPEQEGAIWVHVKFASPEYRTWMKSGATVANDANAYPAAKNIEAIPRIMFLFFIDLIISGLIFMWYLSLQWISGNNCACLRYCP
jgi:cytochrome b subunit of formate dehydrogenase